MKDGLSNPNVPLVSSEDACVSSYFLNNLFSALCHSRVMVCQYALAYLKVFWFLFFHVNECSLEDLPVHKHTHVHTHTHTNIVHHMLLILWKTQCFKIKKISVNSFSVSQ